MKNSFTRFSDLAGLPLAAAGLLGLILVHNGAGFWVGVAVCGLGIGLTALGRLGVGSGSDNLALAQILGVCSEAANGNLAARVVKLPPCQDLIRQCGRRLNALLDFTEVFCKEADTAMQFANQRKYFRKIILVGMRGDFARHSRTINATLDGMRDRDLAALRFAEEQVKVLVQTVMEMAGELKRDAATMADFAQVTALNSNSAGQDASKTSQNVQTVAAAAEELSGSFAEVARQAVVARDTTSSAVKTSETRKSDVLQLKELAQRIGKATELIDAVAQQTNLLALNATIEAAHAGEFGRGFVVVAQEIKLLSNQTADATRDITALINDIQQMAEQTADGILGLNQSMTDIEHISLAVASSAEEQTAVTKDITRNMVEVATASHRISSAITDVRDIAGQCEAKTKQVMGAVNRMEEVCVRLEKELSQFITNIDFRKKAA